MADEQHLTWILELKPDATSLFAVADQIEARYRALETSAATQRAPGLIGSTGNVAGSTATQAGELEAQAAVIRTKLEQAARTQPYLRADVEAAKARLDPNQLRAGLSQVVGSRNVAGVTLEGFNKLADDASRAALRTAAQVEDANKNLTAATNDLASTRYKEAAEEAIAAEALASNPSYIGNVIKKRSAQQYSSAQIEEGLANTNTPAGKQYNDSLVRVRIAQEQLLAQLKERLAGEGAAADGIGTYATYIARAAIAQAAINAQSERVLAGDDSYIASLAEVRAARATEAAGVERLLAAETALGDEYIGAKAALAEARRRITAGVDAVGRGVLAIPGESVESLEARNSAAKNVSDVEAKAAALRASGVGVDFRGSTDVATQTGIVAAAQKELTNQERLAEVTERLTRLKEAQAAGQTTDLDIQEQIRISETELNLALKKQVAAASRAAYDARVATNPGSAGTLFQRIQSGVAGRDGSFRDPQEFQKFGQFLSSRFLTTAGFAVSGLATYAVFSGLQRMVSDSAALEKILQQVRSEFQALGEGNQFNGFRNGILAISRDTGEAAKDVASLALQFKGAFGQQFNNTQILQQVRSAVELARVTGISLSEIENNLTGSAVTYGTTVAHVADVVLTLQDRTGVAAKESIQALSDMAVAASDAGLSVEQTGAIATVAAKYTGQSGASVAEGLNRILPAIGTKAAQIVALFQQANPGQLGKVSDALAAGETGKVFDLLGQGYNKLSRAQQNYLISLLGSRRDAKTAIDVFQHYGEVQADTAAALDSSGRLEKSYGALQDTLSQQLSRVGSAFKNIGAALLSLGLSDLIQNLAKAIGVLVGAVSDIVTLFTRFDDTLHGIPGKLLAIVIAVKALSALGPILAGAGLAGAVGSIIPGVGAGRTTPGRVRTTISPVSGTEVVAEDAALVGINRAPAAIGGALGKLGTKIEQASADSSKFIAKSGAAMGSALTGFGQAIEAFAPILLILALSAGIEDAIKGFSQTKDKLNGLSSDILGEGGFGTSAGTKDIAKYAETRDKATHQGISLNPFTDFKRAGEVLAGLGSKSASDVADDQVQQSTTKAFGQVLGSSFSKSQLDKLRKAYNDSADSFNDNVLPGGTKKDKLSKSELDKIIKEGTTDNGEFAAVVELFTQSSAEKQGLGQAYQKIINGDKAHAKDVSDLKNGLEDLPNLQIKYETNEISSEEFITTTAGLLETTKRLLLDAIRKHSDPAYIAGLKSSYDQEKQLHDQAISARLKQAQEQASQASLLGGLNTNQSSTLQIRASIQALKTTPDALRSPDSISAAQDIVKAQQAQVQFLADHANSVQEAQKIIDAGFTIDPTVLRFLQLGALKSLPKNFADPLRESAKIVGHKYETILEELVLAQGGFNQGIKQYIQTLKDKIVQFEALGGHQEDIDALNRDLTAIQGLVGSGAVPGGHGKTVDVAGPTTKEKDDALNAAKQAAVSQNPLGSAIEAQNEARKHYDDAIAVINDKKASPNAKAQARVDAQNAFADLTKANQQNNDAQNGIAQSKLAIAASLANGDPVKQAQAAIDAANLQMQQAQARGDEAGVNNAIAAYNNAQFQMQQALQGIAQAYVGVLSAAADGNPVKAAQAAIIAAQVQAQNAHGEAEKLNALAAEISAKHALRDALNAVADAQKNIVIATLEAAGKTVEAAQATLAEDKAVLNRYLKQHPGSTVKNDAQAAGLYQKTVTDTASVRDAALQNSEDDIQFLLDTKKITTGVAIARLKNLDANVKLTKAEHRQLETQIYNLQHQSEQDLQFNLPSDIRLPTLYEAKRYNQSGGAAGYQDNRKIEVHITTNAKLDGKDVDHLVGQVTNAIAAPPRYGTRRGTY